MADQSEKGIEQSGGIMVNYLYRYVFIERLSIRKPFGWHSWTLSMFRLENIEDYALSYSGTGHIHASPSLS